MRRATLVPLVLLAACLSGCKKVAPGEQTGPTVNVTIVAVHTFGLENPSQSCGTIKVDGTYVGAGTVTVPLVANRSYRLEFGDISPEGERHVADPISYVVPLGVSACEVNARYHPAPPARGAPPT
jgi:hypothetical protein